MPKINLDCIRDIIFAVENTQISGGISFRDYSKHYEKYHNLQDSDSRKHYDKDYGGLLKYNKFELSRHIRYLLDRHVVAITEMDPKDEDIRLMILESLTLSGHHLAHAFRNPRSYSQKEIWKILDSNNTSEIELIANENGFNSKKGLFFGNPRP